MNDPIKIAIISAGAVLCGVIISQLSTLLFSFVDKRHKKQQHLHQKCEEVMFYFVESLQWIMELDMSTTEKDFTALSHTIAARTSAPTRTTTAA